MSILADLEGSGQSGNFKTPFEESYKKKHMGKYFQKDGESPKDNKHAQQVKTNP